MTFTLLPAVDVAEGRVIRSANTEGANGTVPVGPLDAALAFQREGAEWIHLVDVDAAFGRGENAQLLSTVIAKLEVPVELSAGIDNDASLKQALASGCTRIVLSTNALKDPSWCARVIETHGDLIAIALDVQTSRQQDRSLQYRLAARGSNRDVGELWEALAWLDALGCCRYIITDVAADGMMTGPNLDLYRRIVRATETPVIASGGVSSINDVIALATLAEGSSNLEGVVVGKALHAEVFTLPEAKAATRSVSNNGADDQVEKKDAWT